MKHLSLFLLLLTALPAQATFLYAPDGSRIAEGDTAAKVVLKMGEPLTTTQKQVCLKVEKELCTQWTQQELWQYVVEGYIWQLDMREGKVHSLEWHHN